MRVRPWKLLTVVFVTAFAFAFVYRWTEQYGVEACVGCKYAIGVSALAGIGYLLPLLIIRLNSVQSFFLSVIIGSGARVLLTIASLVAVALIIETGILWFFGYAGLFYSLSLIAETLFVVRVLRRDQWGNSIG